ncbi:MAG: bactofilin family protein [Endozoicomonas sp.]
MWGRNKQETKQAVAEHSSTTLISAGTEIRGDMTFNGAMHVEGRISGNLDSEQGQLTLSEGGAVDGDIRAPRIVINGNVRGNVYASEHLELAIKAVITGNVYYNLLEMTKGSQVNGSLEHHPNGMPDVTPLLEKARDVEVDGEVIGAGQQPAV